MCMFNFNRRKIQNLSKLTNIKIKVFFESDFMNLSSGRQTIKFIRNREKNRNFVFDILVFYYQTWAICHLQNISEFIISKYLSTRLR